RGRIAADDPRAGPLLTAAVLNSDVELHGEQVVGSSTERALIDGGLRAGLDPCALRALLPRRRLLQRRDGIRYVISEHAGELGFVKGAPEQVVALCQLDAGA